MTDNARRFAAAGHLRPGMTNAHAANVLWTPRGGFLVTQECISTPLIPVYLAAVCAHSTTWRRLILGVLAAAPLFIALGILPIDGDGWGPDLSGTRNGIVTAQRESRRAFTAAAGGLVLAHAV